MSIDMYEAPLIKRAVLALSLAVGVVLVGQSTASACSRAYPPTIEEVAENPDGSYAGVYQLETLAQAPSIGLRYAVTATVVTRHWGVPPTKTGIEVTGGKFLPFLFYGNGQCGPRTWPPVGESGYGPTTGNGAGSRSMSVIVGPWTVGELTPSQVEALGASYGPSTTIETTLPLRLQAVAAVWWENALIIAIVVGAGALFIAVRRLRTWDEPE